ncbi:MAG: leucine-rich repeat protein [Clostridia bacterium]|nr:leucine-rich repeat protein [Clostridia bacterium]
MKTKKIITFVLAILMVFQVASFDVSVFAAWGGTTWEVTCSGNTFTVIRSGNISSSQSVSYRTVGLSALEGYHFNGVSGTLTFDKNVDRMSVTVTEKPGTTIPGIYAYYKYQNVDRTYRFEVLDESGFVLADCTKGIGYSSFGIDSSAYKVKTIRANTDTIKVTDGGFKQAYHAVPTEDYFDAAAPQEYLNVSGAKLYATVNFEVAEDDEGYQYVQILSDNASTYDADGSDGVPSEVKKSLYMAGFEQYNNRIMRNFYTYGFPVTDVADNEGKAKAWDNSEFNNSVGDLIRQNFKSDSRSSDGRLIIPTRLSLLVIRFDASGNGNDDWFAQNIKVNIQAVASAPRCINVLMAQGLNAKHHRVTVSLAFDQIVNVTGVPTLSTSWGTLKYETGSGTNVLAFTGEITASEGTQMEITGLSGTVNNITGASFSWEGTQPLDLTVGSTRTPQSVDGVIQIGSVSDLLYFADRIKSYPATSAVLSADIDLSRVMSFTSMGGSSGYSGTFDGNGHTIYGLKTADPSNGYGGFFAKIAAAGAVKNLNFEATDLSYGSSVTCGVVCGQNNGAIEKCTVSGTLYMRNTANASGKSAGAVCGQNTGTVKDCLVYNGDNAYILNIGNWNYLTVGGVVGSNSGTVESCLYYSRYAITSRTGITRGAIVGNNSGTVRNCFGLHHNDNYFSGCVGNDTGTVEDTSFLEAEEFGGGAVCYQLNGNVNDGSGPWGQNIDGYPVDPVPVPGGPAVYVYKQGTAYTNTRYYSYTLLVSGPSNVRVKAVQNSLNEICPGEAPSGAGIRITVDYSKDWALRAINALTGETTVFSKTNDFNEIEREGEYEFNMPAGDVTISVVLLPVRTASFFDYKGFLLEKNYLMVGAVPVYYGNTPEKPADTQYSWYFDGWERGNTVYAPNEALPVLNSSVSYYAHFRNEVNYYDITFQNDDGTVLQTESLPYGDTPEYKGQMPEKEGSGVISYLFKGWDEEIVPVTGEKTYVATYYQNESGALGDFTWSVSGGTLLTVSGAGAFTLDDPLNPYPWAEYGDQITDLVIEEGVAGIGPSAFANFESLENVSLPTTLTTVGQLAFANCAAITRAIYAGSETQWERVFVDDGNDCMTTALECSLHSIREDVKAGGSVSAPLGAAVGDTVTFTASPDQNYLIKGARAYCYVDGVETDIPVSRLDDEFTFEMPDADVYVCADFFVNLSGSDNYVEWTLYDGVLTVGGFGVIESRSNYLYGNYSDEITSVVIGGDIFEIGDGAFNLFSNLKSVSFSEDSHLQYIDNGAFSHCASLEAINIPSGVVSIGEYAFGQCEKMTSVSFAADSELRSIGEGAFCRCETLSSVSIPAGVEDIGQYAFCGCSSLETLTFVQNGELVGIGDGAFEDCSALKRVDIPDNLRYPGNGIFKGCTSLECLNIPNSSSLPAITEEMFSGCENLTEIYISSSVGNIYKNAFFGCPADPEIYYRGSEAGWNHTFIITEGNYSLFTENITFGQRSIYLELSTIIDPVNTYVPNGGTPNETVSVTVVPEQGYVVENVYFVYTENGEGVMVDTDRDGSVYSFVMPDADITLYIVGGRYILSDYSNITWELDGTALTLSGSGDMPVPDFASGETYPWKEYDEEISTLTVGDGITSIGESAFEDCISLNTVAMASSVTSIGREAFKGCAILTSVDLSSGLTCIGERAFSDCVCLLSDVVFSEGLTVIEDEAFRGSSIWSLSLPLSIERIGDGAFDMCDLLSAAYVSYAGTREQWEGVAVGSRNDVLDEDMMHFVKEAIDPGDVDGDGIVTLKDISALKEYIAGTESLSINVSNSDVDGDGVITLKDISALKALIAG